MQSSFIIAVFSCFNIRHHIALTSVMMIFCSCLNVQRPMTFRYEIEVLCQILKRKRDNNLINLNEDLLETRQKSLGGVSPTSLVTYSCARAACRIEKVCAISASVLTSSRALSKFSIASSKFPLKEKCKFVFEFFILLVLNVYKSKKNM